MPCARNASARITAQANGKPAIAAIGRVKRRFTLQ